MKEATNQLYRRPQMKGQAGIDEEEVTAAHNTEQPQRPRDDSRGLIIIIISLSNFVD